MLLQNQNPIHILFHLNLHFYQRNHDRILFPSFLALLLPRLAHQVFLLQQHHDFFLLFRFLPIIILFHLQFSIMPTISCFPLPTIILLFLLQFSIMLIISSFPPPTFLFLQSLLFSIMPIISSFPPPTIVFIPKAISLVLRFPLLFTLYRVLNFMRLQVPLLQV